MSFRDYVDNIWNSQPDQKINIENGLYNYYLNNGKNKYKIMDTLKKDLKKTQNLFLEKIEDSIKRDIIPNYRFTDNFNKILIGCFFFCHEDIKHKILHRSEIKVVIDDLSWKQFENFAKHILELYEFERCAVGKGTKDGGLDFYGYKLQNSDANYGGLLGQLNNRIFGQAKHYTNNVNEREIHLIFSQHYGFVRRQDRAYEYVIKNASWFLDIEGPISALLMTNVSFSNNAIILAKRRDILLRDGEQLVEDVIRLSKDEPWFKEEDDSLVFNKKKLADFLKEI